MTSYNVGSVIWVIHTDRPGLMAYQVIEEITKKDLSGEKVHYIVQPASPKSKAVQLGSIKGQVFHNSDDAQTALIENATRAIEVIVEKTQNLVDKYFDVPESSFATGLITSAETESKPVPKPKSKQKSKKQPKEKLPDGYAWVELDDGTKVKMQIPEELR